ncbi:MAG: hypothetical protein ABH986_06890 [archaeon]
MAARFPCEIIGWTILPSIRRELTLYLIKEKKMQRKKVCEMLDLTPAALSQYVKGKRGKGIKLTKEEKKKIHEMGDYLTARKQNKKNFVSQSCEICKVMRKKKSGCCE